MYGSAAPVESDRVMDLPRCDGYAMAEMPAYRLALALPP